MTSSKASPTTAEQPAKAENPDPSPNPAFLTPASDAGAAPAAASSSSAAPSASAAVDGDIEDECLRGAEALTREEVLRRRSRHVRQLARCYRRQYWALMEELRVKHRDYYWEFGVSPFEEEAGGSRAAPGPAENGGVDPAEAGALGGGEEVGGPVRFGFERDVVGRWEERKKCAYAGCKSKAMPLTRYCHPHILSDKGQKLYKPCAFVTKSCGQSGTGAVICAKPVTRSADPSLCPPHFERYQRSISQAMKRAGVNVSSSSKPLFKLNLVVVEYVHQIQSKRREALNNEESPWKEDKAS